MAKYKISKKLQKWMDDYTETFGGIEPIMEIDDLKAGKVRVDDFKMTNIQWMRDHVNEQLHRLENI